MLMRLNLLCSLLDMTILPPPGGPMDPSRNIDCVCVGGGGGGGGAQRKEGVTLSQAGGGGVRFNSLTGVKRNQSWVSN